MAASVASSIKPAERAGSQDDGFAVGIVFIVTVLFLPLLIGLVPYWSPSGDLLVV